MFEFLRQFVKQFQSVLKRLNPTQKVVILVVFVAGTILVFLMMIWATQKEYVVLYSNLEPDDAQMIREKLEEGGIPYRLETEGTAILVPEGEEMGLRLEFAAEGLMTTQGVGYEIFDRPNLGLTDFIQRLNYRRGLEGELSRTIRSLNDVERARVSIVLPEEALFVEDQHETTASVLLTLVPGRELTREQVHSIAQLVSKSVEGLLPENISIVDSYGNNLSRDLNRDPLILLTANQIEIQREVEGNLRREVETLLNRVLGPDKSIVRVSAELDFTKTQQESHFFDPASQVVRSEERNEGSGSLTDTVGAASQTESSIMNYEINQTVTKIVQEYGRVSRLTVSVTIDTGRTAQEINSLRNLISTAVGLDEENRNDELQILQVPFDTTVQEEERRRIEAQERQEFIAKVLRYTLLGAAGIIFLIVLRSIFKSLDLLLPKPKPKPAIDIEAEAIEEEISAEAQRRSEMLDKVSRFAREKPENVASLLTTWLFSEEKGT